VGAIIGVHGDEKGIVLPPAIAPHQAVVVPIFKKDDMEEVVTAAKALAEELDEAGIRVHMDDRDLRPGEKFYHWERRGVPLRLELGPRDIKHGQVMVAARDTGEKSQVRREEILETVETMMADMQWRMLDRAEKELRSRITDMDDIPRDYGRGTLRHPDRDGAGGHLPWRGHGPPHPNPAQVHHLRWDLDKDNVRVEDLLRHEPRSSRPLPAHDRCKEGSR
jgi:hypothetical protein